ncbi:hypothetical protein [Nocardia cyriacigeorgica]|uniref:hypothetical protein n=1 Tax=Nocardia cyriacigeorgica TaxID=135487 RepID=UPI00030F57CE|nr:hypothetical protein [Nocardia cyriacigeorgica]AVH21188.1 hypothetical protein C5B73_06615 [Nocardia cyriacigeorgica]MBF6499387.1 hypothetical protein [Nocardia cyriacigeorgica]PPJ07613.1 hypothetical protein C5E43_18240 [Nocardia cyriacigeorgica]TLF58309.1 hypothetical protein FEK31_09755 [Nocardia cyriacigeorgica]
MIGALACLVLALLLAPLAVSQRRFRELFGEVGKRPTMRRGTLFQLAAPLACACAFLLGIGPLTAAVLLAATLIFRGRRSARDRRHAAECGYLLDALESVIGELRVGAHPSRAAETAAGDAKGIAAQVFAVGAARSRLGGSGADGLCRPESVIAAELDRVAEAWRVAEHHGLALAELLGAARVDLIGRIRFRGRTTAALAGAKATATVLAGLPLLGVGLGQLMGAAPLEVLFTAPAGAILLPLGTALACAGLLWSDEITRRVLL